MRSSNDRPNAVVGVSFALLCVSLVVIAARAQQPAVSSPAQPAHAVSGEFNRALGVECTHCHAGTDFRSDTKPTFDFARRMEAMVRGLNAGPLADLGGVTCWSCHRGHATPTRLARDKWQPIAAAHAADFAGGRDGLDLAMAVYSASLGVNCTHCHVAGTWADATRRGHQMVDRMSKMFPLIATFFEGSTRKPVTQCFMCHQGSVHVERD